MTKQLTIHQKLTNQNALDTIQTLGVALAKSGMFGLDKAEQGVILVMTAFEQGKSLIEVALQYDVIQGKIAKKSASMLADFQAEGGRVKWIETTGTICKAEFMHPEFQPEGLTLEVTLEELKSTGVAMGRNGLKDNYKKHPRQMLRARLVSEAIRMIAPHIVVGLYTPEEVKDFTNYSNVQDADYSDVSNPTPTPTALLEKQLDYTDFIDIEDEKPALAFLKNIGWLSADETLENLKPQHLKSISEKPEAFIEKAKAYYESMNNE